MFDRPTSFFVAPDVMLYEKQCAGIACETEIESPPKKMKLKYRSTSAAEDDKVTHKKGIHTMFSSGAPIWD